MTLSAEMVNVDQMCGMAAMAQISGGSAGVDAACNIDCFRRPTWTD